MRERSALEHHPELAQLWTLHYAGRVALQSIEYARSFGPPLFVKPAVEDLRSSIAAVLEAIERYKAVVDSHPDELRVMVPRNWTPEQADALYTTLTAVADRAWSANRAPGRAEPTGPVEASGSSGRTRPR